MQRSAGQPIYNISKTKGKERKRKDKIKMYENLNLME